MKLYITLLFLFVGLLCVHASDPQPLRQLGVTASCNQFTTFSTYDGIESVSNASVENKACELTNLLGPQFGVFNFAAYPLRMFMDGEEGFEAMTNNYASAIQGAPYNKTAYLLMGRMIVTEGGDVTSYRYKIKVQFPNTGVWANLPNGYKGYIQGQVQEIIDAANNSPSLKANDIEYNVLTKFHALVVNLLAGNMTLSPEEIIEAEEFIHYDFQDFNPADSTQMERKPINLTRKLNATPVLSGKVINFTTLFYNGQNITNSLKQVAEGFSEQMYNAQFIITDNYILNERLDLWKRADSLFEKSSNSFVIWINYSIGCKDENCTESVTGYDVKSKLVGVSEDQAFDFCLSEMAKAENPIAARENNNSGRSSTNENPPVVYFVDLLEFKFKNFENYSWVRNNICITIPGIMKCNDQTNAFLRGFVFGAYDYQLSFMQGLVSLAQSLHNLASRFPFTPSYIIDLAIRIYKNKSLILGIKEKFAADVEFFQKVYNALAPFRLIEKIGEGLKAMFRKLVEDFRAIGNGGFNSGYALAPYIIETLLFILTGGVSSTVAAARSVANLSKGAVKSLIAAITKQNGPLMNYASKIKGSAKEILCRLGLSGGCFTGNTLIRYPFSKSSITEFKPNYNVSYQ